MSINKKEKRLIVSAQITPDELKVLEELVKQSGATLSTAVRGVFRLGLKSLKNKKIGTLEVIRIGSVSQ